MKSNSRWMTATLIVGTAAMVAMLSLSPAEKEHDKMTPTNNPTGTVCTTVCGLPSNDEELKKLLTPEQYRIMRQNGTEAPFKNAYWDNHEEGIYVDAISGVPLFSSKDKFESGTGWPSFTRPLASGAVKEISDTTHGMERVEVRSASSNSHLGHVFDDGPQPTGQRFCMNSASLKFVPVADLEKDGLGSYLTLFGKEAKGGAATKSPADQKTAVAIFGAGCFWGVEEAFRELPGVKSTTVGYSGGATDNPTYKQVCTDTTGHAEVVKVEYDPSQISYDKLLEVFWTNHNPTQKNRQGPDYGTQYRSVIFYNSPEQEKAAQESKAALEKSGKWKQPIATEIQPAAPFWPAEDYHQQYLFKRGEKACHY